MNDRQKLVLVISILASFVTFLDGSVVNIALPAIVHSLGGGLVTQQWVVDAYLITLGSFILVAGSLSDLFGRTRILTLGLLGFAIMSVLCAIAPSGTFLIVSRALQGVAGALLVPSSLALIISAFKGAAQAKAIGTWTAWTGIAFIIGPLLGGVLIEMESWRLIFAINVVPIAITLWLVARLEHTETPRTNVHVDYVGSSLCALALGGIVYGFIEQPHYGWTSPMIYIPLIVGVVALGLFVRQEQRIAHPMLPLSLFRVRNFLVGNLATLSVYAGLSVATFLIAVFVQQVGKYSAIEAGLALMPVTILMFILSSRFGELAGKFGPRFFMAAGPIIGAAGFLTMLRVDASITYWTQLFPGILIFGLGLSMTVAPLTAAVLGSIKSGQAGIGSAINNAVARIAGLLAIAAIGVVVGHKITLDSFHQGVVFMAALLFIGGIVSWLGIRNPTKAS